MVRIYRMTATFGRLQNETLFLTPGLNIFTAPNEAGKSTWAAFLLAMFYGIDTKERAAKGALPAKTKYLPWSGKPMEGVIELNWNGQDITIERRSENRAPMGVFTAYDTRSGAPIPGITGENCGKTILGVERSVFARSAFIGQNALAVTPDATLEQRLLQLVTTGDETISFIETEKRLREWKNHVRHNKTGYLPETESKLAAVEAQLEAHRRGQEEVAALRSRREALAAECERLQYIEENLQAWENMQKRQRIAAAENAVTSAQEALSEAEAVIKKLPSLETLVGLQKDLLALPQMHTPKKKLIPYWICTALALLCGIVGWFYLPLVAYISLPLAALFLTVGIVLSCKQKAETVRLQRHEAALFTAVRAFADNIYTPEDAAKAVTSALANHSDISSLQAKVISAKSTYDALCAALGPIPQTPPPTEDFTDRYTLQEVSAKRLQAEQTLHDTETDLAGHLGAFSAMESPEVLVQQKEALNRRREALEQRNAALTLALETLSSASEQLRKRFSPQLAATAAELLRRMTCGRYDAVQVEQDMTLHARQTGEAVRHELLTLSGGTADQLYLALRLAICHLALESGTPLILDDALVFFDDDRLAETLELLKEESSARQILLFTCQSREADYMKKTP